MAEIWAKISEFASDPLATLAGLILGLSGITLAVLFYFKSRRFKELKYYVTSRTLFDELEKKLEGLQITYNSKPQKRITVTRIAVWNSGTETIVPDDIPTKYPLCIHLGKECEVLGISVARVTDNATSFLIETMESGEEGTKITFSFAYLDKGDGVTIQIVHNAQESIPIKLEGKIKGGQGPNELDTRSNGKKLLLRGPKYSWTGFVFYLVFGIMCITAWFVIGHWGLIAFGLFCFLGAFVLHRDYSKAQLLMKYLRDL